MLQPDKYQIGSCCSRYFDSLAKNVSKKLLYPTNLNSTALMSVDLHKKSSVPSMAQEAFVSPGWTRAVRKTTGLARKTYYIFKIVGNLSFYLFLTCGADGDEEVTVKTGTGFPLTVSHSSSCLK